MAQDLLSDYLEHQVEVSLSSSMQGQRASEEGILKDCSNSGILLEQDDGVLAFIPMPMVRAMRIKPKPTFWQRLTGS